MFSSVRRQKIGLGISRGKFSMQLDISSSLNPINMIILSNMSWNAEEPAESRMSETEEPSIPDALIRIISLPSWLLKDVFILQACVSAYPYDIIAAGSVSGNVLPPVYYFVVDLKRSLALSSPISAGVFPSLFFWFNLAPFEIRSLMTAISPFADER